MAKLVRPKENAVHRSFFLADSTRDKVHIKSTDKKVVVSLQLEAEGGRKRKIGTVTKSTKTMEIKRKRTEHLFRMGNAYGFNEYILREAKLFDTIRLSDEFGNWKIPVKFILENGEHLNFKQSGYELQLFVNILNLEPYKILPKEKRRL